jgi:hypothetical protein
MLMEVHDGVELCHSARLSTERDHRVARWNGWRAKSVERGLHGEQSQKQKWTSVDARAQGRVVPVMDRGIENQRPSGCEVNCAGLKGALGCLVGERTQIPWVLVDHAPQIDADSGKQEVVDVVELMGGHGQSEPDDVRGAGSPRMAVVHGRMARQIEAVNPAHCWKYLVGGYYHGQKAQQVRWVAWS